MTHDISAICLDLVRKHSLAAEKLTEQQLADAIRQALLSGDFIRYITPSGAQSVVYLPFSEVEGLRAQVAELKALLPNNAQAAFDLSHET